MGYPQIIDYNEAVQNPRDTFNDPELKSGKVAETNLGLPLALSGGFALTYTVQAGAKKYAVRCFHREVPDAETRYAAISGKLKALNSRYFMNFDFQKAGVRVRGNFYPIVKMDWADGKTLGEHLDQVASNRATVVALRQSFVDLAGFLERNGIAHGDIQNENVIVARDGLRLIDYDGMFVPGMPEGKGSEVGQKHFQHPGRTPRQFGPAMDRFSSIVLDVSLETLSVDPLLHRRFREGGQAIIFKANDFADPHTSEIFRILQGMPALRDSASKLAAICAAPIAVVPALTDFIAGRRIPAPAAPTVGAGARPATVSAYIGAYPVLDAKDFAAVARHVGDKIELVGQIVSVFKGTGRRGKGRGRPYVFVNFGIWNQESVKLTIWSDGLAAITDPPTEAWIGTWISVTGLVEPPYNGNHYGKLYRNVGITVVSGNQIVRISETNARFRLGRGGLGHAPVQDAREIRPSNDEILKSLTSGHRAATGARNRPTRVATPTIAPIVRPSPAASVTKTRNEEILGQLRASSTGVSQAAVQSSSLVASNLPHKGNGLPHIPIWLWYAAILIVLAILGHA